MNCLKIYSIIAVLAVCVLTPAKADQYDDYANKDNDSYWAGFLETAQQFGLAAGCGLVNTSSARAAIANMAFPRYLEIYKHSSNFGEPTPNEIAEKSFEDGRKDAKVDGYCDHFPAHPADVVDIRNQIDFALRFRPPY